MIMENKQRRKPPSTWGPTEKGDVETEKAMIHSEDAAPSFSTTVTQETKDSKIPFFFGGGVDLKFLLWLKPFHNTWEFKTFWEGFSSSLYNV